MWKKITYLICINLLLWSCGKDDEGGYESITNQQEENKELDFQIPSNFPDLTYDLAANPPTEKGFELGKKLFYDGKLSSDGVVRVLSHSRFFIYTSHSYSESRG